MLSGCTQRSPLITYGEFPFRFVYSLNDNIYEIENTVIAAFKGIDMSGVFIGMRSWDTGLKNRTPEQGRNYILIQEENVYSILTPGRLNREIRIQLNVGVAAYYMGDPNSRSMLRAQPSIVYFEVFHESSQVTHHFATNLTEEQLKEHFRIEVLEFSFSEPIRNSFRR